MRTRADERCPFCHDGFSGGPRRVCGRCAAPHHAACWQEGRNRCATCGAFHVVEPRVRMAARTPRRTARVTPSARDAWVQRLCFAAGVAFVSSVVHRVLEGPQPPTVIHVTATCEAARERAPDAGPVPPPPVEVRVIVVLSAERDEAPAAHRPASNNSSPLEVPSELPSPERDRERDVQPTRRASDVPPRLPPAPPLAPVAPVAAIAEPPTVATRAAVGPTRPRHLPPALRPLRLAYCRVHGASADPRQDLRLVRPVLVEDVTAVWRPLADAGEVVAIRELALALASERTREADRRAKALLERAAAAGDRSALRSLGALLLGGQERDARQGVRLLRQAERGGDREAAQLLTAALAAYPHLRLRGDPR